MVDYARNIQAKLGRGKQISKIIFSNRMKRDQTTIIRLLVVIGLIALILSYASYNINQRYNRDEFSFSRNYNDDNSSFSITQSSSGVIQEKYVNNSNGLSYSSSSWANIAGMEIILSTGAGSQLDVQFSMQVNYTTDATHKIRLLLDDTTELSNITLKKLTHTHDTPPSHIHTMPSHNHSVPLHIHGATHSHPVTGDTGQAGGVFDRHTHNVNLNTLDGYLAFIPDSPGYTDNQTASSTGSSTSGPTSPNTNSSSSNFPVTMRYLTDPLTVGSHKVQAQWWTEGKLQSGEGLGRQLIVRELNPLLSPSWLPEIHQTNSSSASNEVIFSNNQWTPIPDMEVDLTTPAGASFEISYFMTAQISPNTTHSFRLLLDGTTEIGNIVLKQDDHNHIYPSHTHTVPHNHSLDHDHWVPSHAHSFTGSVAGHTFSPFSPTGYVTGATDVWNGDTNLWGGSTQASSQDITNRSHEWNVLPVFMTFFTDTLPAGEHKISVEWKTETGGQIISVLGNTRSLYVTGLDLTMPPNWNTGDLLYNHSQTNNGLQYSTDTWATIAEVNLDTPLISILDISYLMTLNYTPGDSHLIRIMFDDTEELGRSLIGPSLHNHAIPHTHDIADHDHFSPSHIHNNQGHDHYLFGQSGPPSYGSSSPHTIAFFTASATGISTDPWSGTSGVWNGPSGPPSLETPGTIGGALTTPISFNLRYNSKTAGTHKISVQWKTTGTLQIPIGSTRYLAAKKLVPDGIGPVITTVSHNPDQGMNEQDTIDINSIVTDISNIKNVSVFYQINTGTWTSTPMGLLSGDTFQGTIGPFNIGDNVLYYIKAFDDSFNTNPSTNDNGGIHYSFLVGSSDWTGPSITNIRHDPLNPSQNDNIHIYANLTDPSGIKNASVCYQTIGGSWESVVMGIDSGSMYTANIGSFPGESTVSYYIKAVDDSLNENEFLDLNDGSFYSFSVSTLTSDPTTDPTTQPTTGTDQGSPGFGFLLLISSFIIMSIIIRRRKLIG